MHRRFIQSHEQAYLKTDAGPAHAKSGSRFRSRSVLSDSYHPSLKGTFAGGGDAGYVHQVKATRRRKWPLSSARADEGARRFGKGRRFITVNAGACVVENLATAEVGVNAGCATGSLSIPPAMMQGVVDGSLLRPPDSGSPIPRQTWKFRRLDPADYPTKIVQPAFEVMRRFRNFRAAWIYGLMDAPPPPALPAYRLLVLMDPRDAAVFHELRMVMGVAMPDVATVEMALALEQDPAEVASLFRQAAPFYVAHDFEPPPDVKA